MKDKYILSLLATSLVTTLAATYYTTDGNQKALLLTNLGSQTLAASLALIKPARQDDTDNDNDYHIK